MKKIIITLVLLMIAVSAAAGLFVRHMVLYAENPVNEDSDRQVKIVVEPGQSFGTITEKLVKGKVIKHPLKFRILAAYQKVTTKIKAGEYRITAGMSPHEILRQLSQGRVILHRLTIAEGLNLYQIADRAARANLCTGQEFKDAATDPYFAEKMGIPAKTLEGYLFPETYFFARPVTAKKLIRTMINRFKNVFSESWEKRTHKLGFSVHEIVILASIIEKETGVEKERKLISSVFHNRLEKGMRLASDPTVIYGIENFDGNLTRRDLRTPTPYNTYTNSGLPQGPIANPGRASLKAALYPADTKYLYFVAKPDNTHYFSTTLKEHNRAVKKYQLNK